MLTDLNNKAIYSLWNAVREGVRDGDFPFHGGKMVSTKGSYYGDASEGVGGGRVERWAAQQKSNSSLRRCNGAVWLFPSGCLRLRPEICRLSGDAATSSLHPRRPPRISTQPDITRHWYLLMFHILPSGSSAVVKNKHVRQWGDTKVQVQVTRASRVKHRGAAGAPRLVRKFCLNTCVGGLKFSSLDSRLTAEAFGSVNVHKANVTGMEGSFTADARHRTAAWRSQENVTIRLSAITNGMETGCGTALIWSYIGVKKKKGEKKEYRLNENSVTTFRSVWRQIVQKIESISTDAEMCAQCRSSRRNYSFWYYRAKVTFSTRHTV